MKIFVYIVTVLVYVALLALILWLLAIRPRRPVKDKIAGLLQLLAVYTLVLGFLSSAGVFDTFNTLQEDLTSRDPVEFLAANLQAIAILFSGMSVALDPGTASSTAMFLLGIPILLATAVILFVYAVIHFVVVVPIAYFGYLLTSIPIDAILNASTDVEIASGGGVIRIKHLVQQNEAAIRNFAVALPAFVTSLVLKIFPLLRRGDGQTKN